MKPVKKPMPDIITDIEKYKKGWTGGLPETPCGFGSKLRQTAIQREWIPEVIKNRKVKSVCDVGCGDLNWISTIDLGCEYTPLDLVPRNKQVTEFNILTEVPDKADMVMCLWLLNHLPHAEAKIALDNMIASGCKYLMITWENRLPDFLDLKYIDSVIIRKRNDSRGNVEIRLIDCVKLRNKASKKKVSKKSKK